MLLCVGSGRLLSSSSDGCCRASADAQLSKLLGCWAGVLFGKRAGILKQPFCCRWFTNETFACAACKRPLPLR
jgi:hypothetical protein